MIKSKGVIRAAALLSAAALAAALFTGCGGKLEGSKLTGGTKGIYGLSGSGMDIDGMVKAAMLTRQNEYDRMYKKEVRQEWLKEAYADLYTEINKFNSVSMGKYKMSSTFAPMQVTSSNSGVVTATANADALETSHAVSVNQLAANAALRSGGILRTDGAEKNSIFLKDIIPNVGEEGAAFEISCDGETGYVIFEQSEIFEQSLTLNDLASRINKTGLNVRAGYDPGSDSFYVDSKSTGKSSRIGLRPCDKEGNYSASGAELLNALSLCCVNTDDNGREILSDAMRFTPADTVPEVCGTDAVVIIDGKTYESAENKLTVSGVTYSLVGVGGSETPVNVTVKMDTKKTIENVRAFVEDYNRMIDRLNELYKEEKYSDYDVLTKEEEEEMSEEQIEKWNKKAKSGLLKGNQTLSKMIGKMREAMYTPVTSVDGEYNTLMSVGISSADSTGHLQLDEDKLTKAVQEDSACICQLFCSPGDDSLSGVKQYGSMGVAYRIFDSTEDILQEMKSYAGTTAGVDGSYLGTLILNLKNKMDNFQDMMDTYRDKMYDKYDAMETAFAQLNSQFVSLGLASGGSQPDNGQSEEIENIIEEIDDELEDLEERMDEIAEEEEEGEEE